MDIKIYGKPTYTYSYLKHRIEQKLKKLGVKTKLIELQKVQDFINANVTSIPAIKVGEKLIQFDDSKKIKDMIAEASDLIIDDAVNSSLFNVIIPVDFSCASLNAVAYAKQLAKYVDLQLNLIHACHPNPILETNLDVQADTLKDWKLDLLNDLTNSINAEWFGIESNEFSAKNKIVDGLAADVIATEGETLSNPLIVMSSSGKGGAIKQFFGSVSTKVVADSQVPVFVVPPNVEFKPIQKIVVAIDQVVTDNQIETISRLANDFDADVHLVHIDENNAVENLNIEQRFLNKLNNESVYNLTIISRKKEEALFEYCNSINAELLVINKSRKNKFIKLLSGSFSRHCAINSKMPLLITAP